MLKESPYSVNFTLALWIKTTLFNWYSYDRVSVKNVSFIFFEFYIRLDKMLWQVLAKHT